MSNEGEGSTDDEPIGLTEAEINGMGRQMTIGERIVRTVMGHRPTCAGCRK